MDNNNIRLVPFSWEKYQAGAEVKRRDGVEILGIYMDTISPILNPHYCITCVYRGKDGAILTSRHTKNGNYVEDIDDHHANLCIREEIKTATFWIGISKEPIHDGNYLVTSSQPSRSCAESSVIFPENFDYYEITINPETGALTGQRS